VTVSLGILCSVCGGKLTGTFHFYVYLVDSKTPKDNSKTRFLGLVHMEALLSTEYGMLYNWYSYTASHPRRPYYSPQKHKISYTE
jgi:hypothetical protein